MNAALAPVPVTPPAGPGTKCFVALLGGPPVAVWTCPQTSVSTHTRVVRVSPDSFAALSLCLSPARLVVVGRSAGRSPVPYLDPAYRATPVVPDSGQSVLSGDEEADLVVSRAHFSLRGAPGGGIVLVNGVPRAGGGVRPPLNGTRLIAPANRLLDPGEEVLIACGSGVTIRLPNHCVLQLQAR
jgi:hypothetical protein